MERKVDFPSDCLPVLTFTCTHGMTEPWLLTISLCKVAVSQHLPGAHSLILDMPENFTVSKVTSRAIGGRRMQCLDLYFPCCTVGNNSTLYGTLLQEAEGLSACKPAISPAQLIKHDAEMQPSMRIL